MKNSMPSLNSKSGFGIMEVLAAAVVLGFLIVGLTQLQKGNREALLRVRARDAANFVAQHVLDSISAIGMKAITSCNTNPSLVYCEPEYFYHFEGKPQLDKRANGISVETKYNVEVSVLQDPETIQTTEDATLFTQFAQPSGPNTISQSLEAVVSWEYKGATQSIRMAKVVR